jgi:hypothetical protein
MGPKCAAACKSLNACQQFREGEWLDEVVIASRTQAAHPFINFAESADDKDWRPDPMFSQALHNGDTIVRRQVYLVSVCRQRIDKLRSCLGIILHNQNSPAMISRYLPTTDGIQLHVIFHLASAVKANLFVIN